MDGPPHILKRRWANAQRRTIPLVISSERQASDRGSIFVTPLATIEQLGRHFR